MDSDEEKQKKAPEPFPQIPVHIFGRIWIERDVVLIALLDEEWVKNMAEKNVLTLGYASTRGDTILTASTQELQKLAVQYADDPKAFSIRIGLCRQEQIQDPNCESAILKQRLVTNDPEAWDSLGQDYSKAGRDDEALAAFSKAAQFEPSGGNYAHNYHYHMGRALLKKSQYGQARKEFLEAHRFRPTDSTPACQIGFSYFLESRFQDAARAFETDLWQCHNNQPIVATLAMRHVGRQEEAKKELGSVN